MKKTIAVALTVMLLVGGMVLMGGGPERPRPEVVNAPVFYQA